MVFMHDLWRVGQGWLLLGRQGHPTSSLFSAGRLFRISIHVSGIDLHIYNKKKKKMQIIPDLAMWRGATAWLWPVFTSGYDAGMDGERWTATRRWWSLGARACWSHLFFFSLQFPPFQGRHEFLKDLNRWENSGGMWAKYYKPSCFRGRALVW